MPNIRQPRAGSMQYWPRKRAKRAYARIRTQSKGKDKGLTAFAGYKSGMTHVMAVETRKTSHNKGEEISVPATIIECPPLRIAGVRFYKKDIKGLKAKKEVLFAKKGKELERKINLPKKDNSSGIDNINPDDFDDIRALVYTQPKQTGFGKKKPELFELSLGGSTKDKLTYVKENFDKEISFTAIFKEGESIDIKAVTRGKGFQGPIRRFGISIRQVKSEKSVRNPGSLGAWRAQGHTMYRIAHAGKMGFHQRTEHNKQIIKLIQDPKEINPKGGFINYGLVKSPCILIKGSIPGAKKRLIILQKPIRMKKTHELPTIQEINIEPKQGR